MRRMLILIAVVLALLCSYGGIAMTSDGSQEGALRDLEAKWLSAGR